MASTFTAGFLALFALLSWSILGFPVTRRVLGTPLALPFAPVAGWALHNVIAVPVFFVIPMTALNIALVYLVCLALSVILGRLEGSVAPTIGLGVSGSTGQTGHWFETAIPWPCWLLALALSFVCAVAILPKSSGDAILLSSQIYDHAKIAIVDDMARMGLPPGNPFIAHDGSNGQLAYYYLWHFSAAELSRLFGVSGWNADVAMTFFAALTSLSQMMALAVKFSGKIRSAYWVMLFATSCSGRLLFSWMLGETGIEAFIPAPGGLGGWMFQSSWVPQHLISTSCVVLVVLLMTRLSRLPATLAVIPLALLCAAGFESSTWIGGVVFAFSCLALVPVLLLASEAKERLDVLAKLAAAAVLSVILAAPFITAQLASSALRQPGAPIAMRLPKILGDVDGSSGGLVDVLGYWLLLLPLELPGVYLCGIVVVEVLLWRVRLKWQPEATLLAVNTVAALVASWLMVSTLASNNDLGWRAVLLASVGLIVFAAVGVSSWFSSRRHIALALALLSFAIGVPETMLQMKKNFTGDVHAEDRAFAAMPALWQAVREIAGPQQRIANNPRALERLTPWPVNIGWALLADRRSCYAGWELTQVYSAVPHLELWRIDEQFKHVFAGTGTPADVHELAGRFDCSAAVLTKDDGAWNNDPFKDSADFELVREEPELWRIYRRKTTPALEVSPTR